MGYKLGSARDAKDVAGSTGDEDEDDSAGCMAADCV
jgi:hypothetical protein